MSTFLSQARARALRPVASMPRPRLTVVTKAAARAPRVPFVMLVVAVLVAGLIGLLLLNTALQRGAYVATDLRMQSQDLALRQERLGLQVSAMAEPQSLSQRALELGMVSNDSPAFLSLSDGRIIGSPTAGARSNQVDVSHVASPTLPGAAKGDLLAAGEGNSLSTGPVVVPDPHQRTADDKPADSEGSDR